jgi:phospholipid/cholesterol/gamma-HCH transport system ATP-binding protein
MDAVLVFDNVSFDFGLGPVLQDVSFSISPGETLVLHGAAGSGKTVLLKLALGLLRPVSGRIVLFGQDVTNLDESEWYDVRARIGVLFQEGGLFDSLTIAENVAYPLLNQPRLKFPMDQIDARVARSLEFVELGHTLEKVPSELSGGMRRRVGIARAIVTSPELLLYDSPTAGLDPITANTIMALILKERDENNATTLMATHRHQDGEILVRYRWDKRTASLRPVGPGESTRTKYLLLRDGRIAFLGTPEEFDASRDEYVMQFASR